MHLNPKGLDFFGSADRQSYVLEIFMRDFNQDILKELEELLGSQNIETLVRSPSEEEDFRADSAVKLIHSPSGLEVICDDYSSQTDNKSMALVRLAKLLNHSHNDGRASEPERA